MKNELKEIAADIAKKLKEHPDTWTNGEFARDEDGFKCATSKGISWCILGHIQMRNGGIGESFSHAAGLQDTFELAEWNDAPGRTVAEVIALCEQVARG